MGVTIGALAERWLEHAVPTRRNAKGVVLARTRFERYLLPVLGRRVARRLRGDDVRRYRLWLERQGLKPYTVTHILSDLRALLLWASEECWIERSFFPRRVLPRVPETAPLGFSEEQVARLQALPGTHGFVLRFLLGTGLRWAEACRAERAHFSDGVLLVPRAKGGRVRRVPVAEPLAREIESRSGRLVPYSERSPGSFARRGRQPGGAAGTSRPPRAVDHHALRARDRRAGGARGEARGGVTGSRGAGSPLDARLITQRDYYTSLGTSARYSSSERPVSGL
jgi:integrase